MGIIVQKFGGTSVADPEKIKNVAKAVIREKNNGNDVIVVDFCNGAHNRLPCKTRKRHHSDP